MKELGAWFRPHNVELLRCNCEPTSQKVGALLACSGFLNNEGSSY